MRRQFILKYPPGNSVVEDKIVSNAELALTVVKALDEGKHITYPDTWELTILELHETCEQGSHI